MNPQGILIGLGAFLIVGILHPVVVKVEYYVGAKAWPLFLAAGLGCVGRACVTWDGILSPLLSILGFALLWGIRELFEQRKRVAKGWYPKKRGSNSVLRVKLFSGDYTA